MEGRTKSKVRHIHVHVPRLLKGVPVEGAEKGPNRKVERSGQSRELPLGGRGQGFKEVIKRAWAARWGRTQP